MKYKTQILFAALALNMAFIISSTVQKEHLLHNGRRVLLHLRPRDPRSLMQGDYMVLRYRLTNNLNRNECDIDGHLVVKLDNNDVATFVRIHKGEELQDSEQLLLYRKRHGRIKLGAESFFFQEGKGRSLASADYGELRVSKSGHILLTNLCDKNFKPM